MNHLKIINKLTITIVICLGLSLFSGCLGLNKTASEKKPEDNFLKRQTTTWDTKDLKPNHVALAKDLMAKGFYSVALVQLDFALEQDKKNAEVYNLRGVCARETNNFKDAHKFFNKALLLDKKNAFIHNNLGILYSMENKPDPARKSFTTAMALDPGQADFFNNAGVLFLKTKEYEQAETNFSHALLLQPGHENAVNNLAICFGYLKQYKKAMTLLLEHRSYETACYNMGYIYLMQKESAKAEKMFKASNITNLNNSGQKPFDTQVINPAPQYQAPPTGMSGNTGNAIFNRYQKKLKDGE